MLTAAQVSDVCSGQTCVDEFLSESRRVAVTFHIPDDAEASEEDGELISHRVVGQLEIFNVVASEEAFRCLRWDCAVADWHVGEDDRLGVIGYSLQCRTDELLLCWRGLSLWGLWLGGSIGLFRSCCLRSRSIFDALPGVEDLRLDLCSVVGVRDRDAGEQHRSREK